MERYLNIKRIACGGLVLILSALLPVSCTYLPRPEELETVSGTVAESESVTTAETAAETDGEDVNTDADGFPNEPEDGHTKRY